MAERKYYDAFGEEAARGTAESTTVGFIPMEEAVFPSMVFTEEERKEQRGEDTVIGPTDHRRVAKSWTYAPTMPFFTEAGTTAGMVGTILKHFFGKVTSVQNASTGQYAHMFYPTADPFSSANLDNDALTVNKNITEGATVKNHAFWGGRVKTLTFTQDTSGALKVGLDMFGQGKEASDTAIASPTFAAEALRADYNNCTLYQGTITKTGTGPDYSQFAFGSAVTIIPESLTVTMNNGMEDVQRLSGTDYPDKTRMGVFDVTLEFTIDYEDPASGFSSVDELNVWLASASTNNFFVLWDTGTQAGTGDNHSLGIDLPQMALMNAEPNFSLDGDPVMSVTYKGELSSSDAYMVGLMLKNTATAV